MALQSAAAILVALSAAGAPPKVGDRAPELKIDRLLQAPDGAKATWESLKGKVVVLEFWATWCGPCVASIPHLNEVSDKLKEQPVQFIAITNESAQVIEPFLKNKPIHAWVALDFKRQTGNAYEVHAIPHTIIVDKQGIIVAITYPTNLTEQILRDVLEGRKISPPQAPPVVAAPPGNDLPPLYQVVVRKSASTGGGSSSSFGPGVLMVFGEPAIALLARTCELPVTRLVPEAKVPEGCYDVQVRLPRPEQDVTIRRLREALETTFGLRIDRERRELEVLLLTLPEGGSHKMAKTITNGTSTSCYGGGFNATAIDLDMIAFGLESQLQKPVLNETGLSSRYDIQLKWMPGDKNSITAAVEEQLGLKLVPAKRTIEVGVIRAISPSEKAPKP